MTNSYSCGVGYCWKCLHVLVCTDITCTLYLYAYFFIVASFIRVVGSEFVQKYLGEGPRMVRDVFRLARENSPAIIFIDEIDAIATKRFDAQTGG